MSKRRWWELLIVYCCLWWAFLIIVAAYGAGWPEWWVIAGPALVGIAHGAWGVR